MKVKRILTGLASLALAAGLAGGLASSAQAQTTAPTATAQHHPAVAIFERDVMNNTPIVFASGLRWSTWNSNRAYSRGTLNVAIPPYANGRFAHYATLAPSHCGACGLLTTPE
jgi:Flp pilus assembly protein CpaB